MFSSLSRFFSSKHLSHVRMCGWCSVDECGIMDLRVYLRFFSSFGWRESVDLINRQSNPSHQGREDLSE